MKYFGNLFVFLFISIELFAGPRAYLTKSEIKKGEPLFLHIELEGKGEVNIKQNVFSKDGVTLEFIGQEESISSINFKVSRKKILKYRVLTNKTGNVSTPIVEYEIDGQTSLAPSQKFIVKNEKFQPPVTAQNFIDRFFNPDGLGEMQERNIETPNPEDFQIHFFASRKKVYVGEAVLASFILYSKSPVNKFAFNRIGIKAVEFPFFLSEQLPNSRLNLTNNREVIDGKEFYLHPSENDLYVITALRRGNYPLGEEMFSIEGGHFSFFQPIQKKSKKKTIQVKDLPEPKPANFSEQVGDYLFEVSTSTSKARIGESIPLILKIKGEGGFPSWKDLLSLHCSQINCNGKIVFLKQEKNRKIDKLKNGEYGYKTETIFHYSFFPEREGSLKIEDLEVNFFNPFTEKYSSSKITFPNLIIEKALPFEKENLPSEFSLNWKYWLIYGLGFAFFSFFIYLIRNDLSKSLAEFKQKFQKFENKIPEEIIKLDRSVGNKKGALLRVFLISKGLDRAKIEELIQLKAKSNLSFEEIYKNSNTEKKESMKKLIQKLFKENQLL